MANSDLLQVANGNNQFAHNFYSSICKEEKKNILFSPLSLHTLLAMLYQGAAGETLNKLTDTLKVSNRNVAATGYEMSISALNNLEDVTLHMANRIYMAKSFKLKDSFKKVVARSFRSEVDLIDFTDSEATVKKINQWVEDQTNSKIKDLIDSQSLSSATSLVLVNAVYFKGDWMYPFPKSNTTVEPFYVSEKEEMECHMMHLGMPHYYCYNGELRAHVLQLRYSNGNTSLVIVLPRYKSGIVDLENKLKDTDLSTITDDVCNSFDVEAALPKFKIETSMDLEPILKEMGLGVIFEESADFSDLSENIERFSVSKATQKTFIEVNEEGTEAAAATGFAVFRCGPQEFTANHPFIVLLQTKYGGATHTLFYGKVMRPSFD